MKKHIFFVLLFLGLFSAPFYAESDLGVVLDDNVRIRTAPSLKYSSVIANANKGEKFMVRMRTEETYNIDGHNEPWYQIDYSSGRYGWIYGGYFNPPSEEICKESYYQIMISVLWGEMYADTMKESDVDGSFKRVLYGRTPDSHKAWKFGSSDYYHYKNKILQIESECKTWESTEYTGNFPNSLSIKIGMTVEELKAIFGPNLIINDWAIELSSNIVIFKVEGNRLKSVVFFYNGT